MADSIILSKAAIYYVLPGSGASKIKLDGFNGVFAKSKGSPPALIQGFVFSDSDVVLPVVALDDKRVLYSFGKNFGEFALTGTIYLSGCESSEDKMNALKSAAEGQRVSSKKSPVNFSAGNFSAKVYVLGYGFRNGNSAVQSIDFEINCMVAPVSNKG